MYFDMSITTPAAHHRARKPSPAASGNDGHPVLRREADHLQNIALVLGQHDAHRLYLIHARVRAIQNARHFIEPHLALDLLHQHPRKIHGQPSSLNDLYQFDFYLSVSCLPSGRNEEQAFRRDHYVACLKRLVLPPRWLPLMPSATDFFSTAKKK